MATISISDARNHFSDAMETAQTEAVFVQRRGRLAGVGVSAYRVELRPAAARSLRTLDPQARRRVQGAIAAVLGFCGPGRHRLVMASAASG